MTRYLRQIRAIRYGGLVDRELGPLAPGLNVVFGPNEAGKTTFASLVGGVLFGWEGAHGVRNTYHPAEGGRAGVLTWADTDPDKSPTEIRRDDETLSGGAAGSDPIASSPAAGARAADDPIVSDRTAADAQAITADIDRATFDTIFSLTADELRSLRNSSDLTARLLTAGSGTSSSPAAAFVEVERRIANTPIYQLEAELETAQARVKSATEQVKLYLQEDREMRELRSSHATTAARVSSLDDELEALRARRAELEAAEARAAQIALELETLRADRAALATELAASAGSSWNTDAGASAGKTDPAQTIASGAPATEPPAPWDKLPGGVCPTAVDQRLLALDSAGDRVLRDRLDELAEEREKLGRALDRAKENSSTSTAAYEALCELDDEEVAASRRLRNRTSQAVVSVLLPIAFILAGIPLFAHGREINSLSFTAFGIGLVVVAIFLAAAAFFVLFRQPPGTEALETRRTDAQWVMLQDRKKLDARLAEQGEFEQRVAEFLADSGLAAADGSLRQARSLLDEARDLRAARAEAEQKATSLDLRIHALEQELATLTCRNTSIAANGAATAPGAAAAASGAAPEAAAAASSTNPAAASEVAAAATATASGTAATNPATAPEPRVATTRGAATGFATAPEAAPDAPQTVAAISALIKDRTAQRDALLEASSDMSHRLGELARELEYARNDHTLDQAKFEYEQLRVRLREAKHELISLLLAKRMLERSIATWESQGQPEVHAQAGRLLAMITDGKWVKVATSPTGSLVAVAADGTTRDPRHLSLGTCQQLYLALRIALLITADDVGRAIPVLADDILVNFDATRRAGAARALAELAKHRQVIVFTCHEETAAALDPAPRLNL